MKDPKQELIVVWRRVRWHSRGADLGPQPPHAPMAQRKSRPTDRVPAVTSDSPVSSQAALASDVSCCLAEHPLSQLQNAYKITCLVVWSGLNVVMCKVLLRGWLPGCWVTGAHYHPALQLTVRVEQDFRHGQTPGPRVFNIIVQFSLVGFIFLGRELIASPKLP